MYKKYIKRFLDIIFSFAFILIFWWLFILLAVIVRIKLGSSVIFKQQRPGLHAKPFSMIKFRTMTDERDDSGNLLPDEKRLTKFGRFLRSTSLDELPEIWLIFTGKMSFVGPRPLLMKYLPLYNSDQMKRHEVRPGLTGYAQAYGRNAISWGEKFEKDLFYVDNVSFFLDLKIIFRTVYCVLKREGISSSTCETMEEFKGNN